MTTMTYQVTGMTCGHCAHAVSSELEGVPGVSAVAVELVPHGTSEVTVTSDTPLSIETVIAALDEAGDYRLAGAGTAGTAAGTAVNGQAIGADHPAPGRSLPVL
jgi:copper chaperone CopZ